MIARIAFRNAFHSAKDFAVFLITIVLSVSIFFAFSAVYPQAMALLDEKIINENLTSLVTLKIALIVASVFVGLMFAFLVVYANAFFLKRRKKELGLYLVLGLSRFQVAGILTLETLAASCMAFVVGIGFGLGVSQLLGLFTSYTFTGGFSEYRFYFSLDGLLTTAVFFVVLLAIVLLVNLIALSRASLVDVLSSGVKNESLKVAEKKKASGLLLGISIILLLVCYALMTVAFISTSFLVFIIGSIAGFLFFLSFSGLLFRKAKRNERFYYRGLNAFTTKQLASSINSSALSLAFVSLTLILTVFLMSLGFGIQTGYKGADDWFGFAYIGVYMGVSFMLVSCAIMAIRQLSLAEDTREQFRFLARLGADRKTIVLAMAKEEASYFLYPLIFAAIAIGFGLFGASADATKYLQADITIGIIISLAIVAAIYLLYFIATFLLSVKAIGENKNGSSR